MPVYKMQAPNGKVYQIDGPAGASQNEVVDAILHYYPEAGGPPAAPAEESALGWAGRQAKTIGQDLWRGVSQLPSGLAQVAEDLPSLALESPVKMFMPGPVGEAISNIGKAAAPAFQKPWEKEIAPTTKTMREASTSMAGMVAPRTTGSVWEARNASEAAASIRDTLFEGAVPTLAAAMTGYLTKNPEAAMAVMAATGAPGTYAGIRQQQKQTGHENINDAVAGTIASTGLDIISGVGGKVTHLGDHAILETLKKGIKEAAKEVGKTSGEEAVTESLQNVIEQVAGGADPTTKQSLMQTLEAGVVGLVGGGVFGSGSELVNHALAHRMNKALGSVPPLHSVEAELPGTEGEKPTRQQVDILSIPDKDGALVARNAVGDIFRIKASELEQRMVPPAEGEERAPLTDTLKERADQREEDIALSRAVQVAINDPTDDTAFDIIANRYARTLGIPKEEADKLVEVQLGRARGDITEGIKTPQAAQQAVTTEVVAPSAAEAAKIPEPTLAGANPEAGKAMVEELQQAIATERAKREGKIVEPASVVAPPETGVEVPAVETAKEEAAPKAAETTPAERMAALEEGNRRFPDNDLMATAFYNGALGREPDSYFKANATDEEYGAFVQGQEFAAEAGPTPTEVTVPEKGAPAPTPAPIPAVEAGAEGAGAEAATEEVPAVPITKVPAAAARGINETRTGMMGTQRGRPVEGAAELTSGMQDEQELVKQLTTLRNNNLISDRDVAEILRLVRVPESQEDFEALPKSQQERWATVLDLHRDAEAKAAQLEEATKPKEKKALAEAIKQLNNQIDAARSALANGAIRETQFRVAKRKSKRQQIETAYKNGEITKSERDIQLHELRIERPLAPVLSPRIDAASEAITNPEATPDTVTLSEEPVEGPEAILNMLDQAVAAGAITEQARDFAKWVVASNPNVVRYLRAYVSKRMGQPHGGEYDPISRLAEIVAGSQDDTAVHEFMHHAERLMPVEAQDAIYDAWKKQMNNARVKSTGKERTYFNNIYNFHFGNGGIEDFFAARDMVTNGTIPRELYQFMSPAEFWADNATDVLQNRYDVKDSVLGRIRQWLGEFATRVKSALGASNTAPVIKALNGLANTTGSALSPTLIGGQEGPVFAPRTERRINKGVKKAELSNNSEEFLKGLDEASAALIKGYETDFQSEMRGIKSQYIDPARFELMTSSWIRDKIAAMRPGLGSIIENMDKLDQKMRGMRNSMQTAMRRRVKEFSQYVNRYGQSLMSAMMTIARVNSVDVTAYKDRADAIQNDPMANFWRARAQDTSLKPREIAAAKAKATQRVNDIEAAWDVWDRLGKQEGGQETYRRVRQFYKDMYTTMRAAQDEYIKSTFKNADPEALERLIEAAHGDDDVENDDALIDDENDPFHGAPANLLPKEYFPFRRFGDFGLLVKGKTKGERLRYHFDTAAERNKAAKRIAAKLGIKPGSEEFNERFTEINGIHDMRETLKDNSIMLQRMFKIIDGANLDTSYFDTSKYSSRAEASTKAKEKLKDKLYQTYLMTLPERSLRKQFIHAELVGGHEADVLRVFKVAASQYASSLPRTTYGSEMENLISAADDIIKGKGNVPREDDPRERAYIRDLTKAYVGRIRDTLDPQMQGPVERRINEFTFMSMMTSLASAMAQPFIILQTMPRMISRYPVQAFPMMTKYLAQFANLTSLVDTDPSTGTRHLTLPTLGNTKFIHGDKLRAELWGELNTKRDLFSQKHSNMALRNQATGWSAASTYSEIVNAMGAVFSSADQLSREMAGMAYAEMEYNKLKNDGKSHSEAIEGAVEASVRNTNETVGNYTELEKPGIMRGNWAKRMFGFLRSYAVSRTAYYFRTIGAMFKGSPYQTRLQAFSELAMVLAFAAYATGADSLPGYSTICWIIDQLFPFFFSDEENARRRREDPLGADDSDYRFRHEWIPRNFGTGSTTTKSLQVGTLSQAMGADISSRLSQNDLWIRGARKQDTTWGQFAEFAGTNLAPQLSEAKNIADAVDDFSNGRWSRGAAKLSPAAVRGLITAARLEKEGERTKNGLPVIRPQDLTAAQLDLQRIGFTPLPLSIQREKNRAIQSWERDMEAERNHIFDEYKRVVFDHEHTRDDVSEVIEEARAYNAKVPKAWQKQYYIEGKDLIKSLKSYSTIARKSFRGVEMTREQQKILYPSQ